MQIAILRIDLGKNSCSLVGLDGLGKIVKRRRMRPASIVGFAKSLPPCIIAMEACCGAHHLGRLLKAQGHEVRLMSPEYVWPYVKAQKNDDRDAEAIAVALRQSLIELSAARQVNEGQQAKMEMVYQYLTGPCFRHRIEAIVEKFSDMQADLDKERKTMTRSWAKREAQIRGVIESTVGMYGDLQGIAGRALPEIDSIDTLSLDYSPKSGSDD